MLKEAPRNPIELNRFLTFQVYKIVIPAIYSFVVSYPPIADFVVAAYLAIRIRTATRAGRSPKDVLRFAVAVYHGMFPMVSTAQIAVKDNINWAPVEAELLTQGHQDAVAYVNEVVQ